MHNRPRITGGLPRAPAPQQPSPGRAYAYASVSTGRLPLRSSLTTPTPPALMGRLPLRSSLTTPTPPALMGRLPLRSSLTTRTPRYRLVGSRSVRPRAASLRVRLRRRAGADQVPVPERPVDPADRREVLVRRRHPGREDRFRPGIRVLPVGGQHGRGVRRTAQRVVGHRPLTVGHPIDLAPDRDHRGAEPVELPE